MGNWSQRAAACLAVLVTASVASAEERKTAMLIISPQVIQRGIADAQQMAARQPPVPLQKSPAHIGRRVLWTSIGAVGGFFAGGYLGVWIENTVDPCNCDDPGLIGALIGAPVGAIAGGVAGFVLSK